MKKFYNLSIIIAIAFLNLNFSFAQTAGSNINTSTFKNFANSFTTDVIATLGTMAMAAAFMFFFYGIALYVMDRANGKPADSKANDFMLWGLVGLFVMVSAWGIIKMAQGLLGSDFASSSQISIKAVSFQTTAGSGTSSGGTNNTGGGNTVSGNGSNGTLGGNSISGNGSSNPSGNSISGNGSNTSGNSGTGGSK